MSTIGSLAVNIVATTDKFITGLNQVSTRLGKFVKSVGTSQAAVVGLGVYGFASFVKGAVDAGGALFDLSQKLRISTEALTALDYAIKQTGGSTDALHTSLTFMAKKLGEAQQGSKSAVEAFAALNINFRDLIGLAPEQQFLKLVNALNQVEGAEQRVAASLNIFGRSGKELQASIAAGTDELIRMGDEAQRVGAVVGTEAAKALDDAADAMDGLGTAWQALKLQLVGGGAPVITALTDAATQITKVVRGLFLAGQSIALGLQEGTARSLKAVTGDKRFDAFIEEAVRANKEIQEIFKSMSADSTSGPLRAAEDQKKVEENTRKTNQKLDEQLSIMRRQAPQPQITLATGAVG